MAIDEAKLLALFNEHTTNLNKIPPRQYLGLSSIGDDCVRKIFLNWRFAKLQTFPPRLYRLFSRGHQEEPRFVDLLRGAGFETVEVDPRTGRQFSIKWFHNHVSGHCDGFAFINGEWHLIEMKTASQKNWLKLKRANDLSVSNFKYYGQMQTYMNGFNLKKGLFLSVNKDNDQMYLEFIDYDHQCYLSMYERCVDLCTTKVIPTRCSHDSTFYICGYCWFKGICFEKEKVNRTCRMCQNVELEEEGKWSCKRGTKNNPLERLTITQQHKGCAKFLLMEG